MNFVKEIFELPHFQNESLHFYFYNNYLETRRLSFADLKKISIEKSDYIRSQGVSGYALLTVSDPIDFILSFCALVLAGCVPVPMVSPNYYMSDDYDRKINNLFNEYKFDFIVCDQKDCSYFSKYSKMVTDKNFYLPSFCRQTQDYHPNSCFIQFSSGSTDEPKGIVINHKQLMANVVQICQALNPHQDNKLLSWLPLFHDMGLIGGVLCSLYHGTQVYLMSAKDYISSVPNYLKFIQDNKINFILGPDFMYRQIAKEISTKNYDLSSLRHSLCGAELVLPSTVRDISSAFKKAGISKNIFQPVYGMAEACLAIAFSSPDEQLISSVEESTEVVSCGQPLEGQGCIVVDELFNTLPEGCTGEIAVSGRSLFTEYYMNKSQPRCTADGYYLTGDMGFSIKGNIYPLGRKRDVIVHNGRKYHSLDLENLVYEKLRLGRLACVQTDEIYLILEVSFFRFMKSRSLKLRIADIISAKIPVKTKNVILVPKYALPRTTSGKVQRYKVQSNINNGLYKRSFLYFRLWISLFIRYIFKS